MSHTGTFCYIFFQRVNILCPGLSEKNLSDKSVTVTGGRKFLLFFHRENYVFIHFWLKNWDNTGLKILEMTFLIQAKYVLFDNLIFSWNLHIPRSSWTSIDQKCIFLAQKMENITWYCPKLMKMDILYFFRQSWTKYMRHWWFFGKVILHHK